MNIQSYKNTQRIILEPGEFYVSTTQEVISTLLGSCVSACLYDPVTHVMGMNHFLLAEQQSEQSVIESDAGKYGIYAMSLLINAMLQLGAKKDNLRAKCFGGANVLLTNDVSVTKSIGSRNVEFIEHFLNIENIPLVSRSLGGIHGMNIHFVGKDYSVYMKKIKHCNTFNIENSDYD